MGATSSPRASWLLLLARDYSEKCKITEPVYLGRGVFQNNVCQFMGQVAVASSM